MLDGPKKNGLSKRRSGGMLSGIVCASAPRWCGTVAGCARGGPSALDVETSAARNGFGWQSWRPDASVAFGLFLEPSVIAVPGFIWTATTIQQQEVCKIGKDGNVC